MRAMGRLLRFNEIEMGGKEESPVRRMTLLGSFKNDQQVHAK